MTYKFYFYTQNKAFAIRANALKFVSYASATVQTQNDKNRIHTVFFDNRQKTLIISLRTGELYVQP